MSHSLRVQAGYPPTNYLKAYPSQDISSSEKEKTCFAVRLGLVSNIFMQQPVMQKFLHSTSRSDIQLVCLT